MVTTGAPQLLARIIGIAVRATRQGRSRICNACNVESLPEEDGMVKRMVLISI